MHGASLVIDFDIRVAFRKDIEVEKRTSWDVQLNFLTGVIKRNLGVESSNASETAVALRIHFVMGFVYKVKNYIVQWGNNIE